MQDKHSNLVYVVTLSNRTPARSTTSWRDVVTVHNLYFHPVGSNYPREPVNYIGFRFDGQLRSIRHVEHVEVVSSLTGRIPGFSYTLNGPHYLYTLGKPIMPSHKVTNGTVVRANRVYAAIDLLLTCSTISEAGRKTRLRLEGTKDQLTSRPGVPSNTHKKTRVAKSLAKVNAKYGKALKRLAK